MLGFIDFLNEIVVWFIHFLYLLCIVTAYKFYHTKIKAITCITSLIWPKRPITGFITLKLLVFHCLLFYWAIYFFQSVVAPFCWGGLPWSGGGPSMMSCEQKTWGEERGSKALAHCQQTEATASRTRQWYGGAAALIARIIASALLVTFNCLCPSVCLLLLDETRPLVSSLCWHFIEKL